MQDVKRQRRLMVLYKAIAKFVAVGITLYVVWYEFDKDIFFNLNFLLVLLLWGVLGVVFFADEWQRAGEKSLHDKLDELITEIRNDRLRKERSGRDDD
ncbi:MAG: hypothetical protein HYX91_05220 [Chloroflexi bacterium]|nr:hypothetical protein [Chloroflexota bacterium]